MHVLRAAARQVPRAGLPGVRHAPPSLLGRFMSFQVNPDLGVSAISRLTDLREPHTWCAAKQLPQAQRQGPTHTLHVRRYAPARLMKRRIVAHLGPTNSGKTHHAIQALKAAKSGVYAGPLRLLAWEQYDRMNTREGTPCSLITGQEQALVAGARHTACTVEMASLQEEVQVAVLDEIQMMADADRGWAWTRALLGLPAHEVHVCGDAAALPLLRQLAASTGEELTVHEYGRLSPLTLEPGHLRSWKSVRSGDCIVAFSRKKLFDIKEAVEASTPLKCGLVYGSLPPTVRREQARAFNEPEHPVSVLVATDAVGMGLNLAIRRVIFSATEKYDGLQTRPLTVSEAKQIAGRAGRFSSDHPEGFVAARSAADRHLLQSALDATSPALPAAGIAPTAEQLELFAACVATPSQRKQLVLERADREFGKSSWRGHADSLGISHGDEDGLANLAAHLLQRLGQSVVQRAKEQATGVASAELYAHRFGLLQQGAEHLAAAGQAGSQFQSLFQGMHGGEGSSTELLATSELMDLMSATDPAPRRQQSQEQVRSEEGPVAPGFAPNEGMTDAQGDYAATFFSTEAEEDEDYSSDDDYLPEEDVLQSTPEIDEGSPQLSVSDLAGGLRDVPPAHFGSPVPSPRDVSFSQLLTLFLDFARVDGDKYFMCSHGDMLVLARALDSIEMPLAARFVFCRAPVDVSNHTAMAALKRYARSFAESDAGVGPGLRVPDRPPTSPWELRALEAAHGVFDMYTWLSQRFPGRFTHIRRARRALARIEGLINAALVNMSEPKQRPPSSGSGRPSRRAQRRAPEQRDDLAVHLARQLRAAAGAEAQGRSGVKQLSSLKAELEQALSGERSSELTKKQRSTVRKALRRVARALQQLKSDKRR